MGKCTRPLSVEIGRVEAGLRTGDLQLPWPEEANRQLTSRLVNLHFAPTQQSQRNLLEEGIDGKRIPESERARAGWARVEGTVEVHLIEPQEYLPFGYLMTRSGLIASSCAQWREGVDQVVRVRSARVHIRRQQVSLAASGDQPFAQAAQLGRPYFVGAAQADVGDGRFNLQQ